MSTSTKQQPRQWIKWLRRVLLGLVLLIVVLLAVGAVYQWMAQANDRQLYLPLSEIVEVDGTELYLKCIGEGSPTVILEAGLGSNSNSWSGIHDTLAEATQVCAYDRSGMGWSAYNTDMVSSEQIANTLHTLLNNAEILSPYVMVGHSAGGVYVRQFAALYPDDVAGIVLVDSSHEQQTSRLPTELQDISAGFETLLRFCRAVAPFGIIRVSGMVEAQFEGSPFSDDVLQAAIAHAKQTHTCSAMLAANNAFDTDTSQVAPPPDLGDIPLIVLTAGKGYADEPNWVPADFPLSVLEEADNIWMDMQSELASLSTESEQIVVGSAGHNIHLDDPDAVIDAILEMVVTLSGDS